MICKNCGTVHTGTHTLPGSGWIELILWLAYIFPGLIYSIWRRSGRRPTCAACGSRDLIPESTPAGLALVKQHYPAGLPVAPVPAAPVGEPEGPSKGLLIVTAVIGLVIYLFVHNG